MLEKDQPHLRPDPTNRSQYDDTGRTRHGRREVRIPTRCDHCARGHQSVPWRCRVVLPSAHSQTPNLRASSNQAIMLNREILYTRRPTCAYKYMEARLSVVIGQSTSEVPECHKCSCFSHKDTIFLNFIYMYAFVLIVFF